VTDKTTSTIGKDAPIISSEILSALEVQESMRIMNAAQDYVDGVFYYGQRIGDKSCLISSNRRIRTFQEAKKIGLLPRKEAASGGRFSPTAILGFLEKQRTVDPRDLFDRLVKHIERYVSLRDAAEYRFLAFYVMMTYIFYGLSAIPYVHVTGEKGSGKTTLMELLAELCFNGVFSSSTTSAVIYRDVDAYSSTLFIDEAENLSQGQQDTHNAYKEVLNAGYKKSGTVRRMGGQNFGDILEFRAYSPKVIGGINGLHNVLQDRTIAVRMVRKSEAEASEPYTQSDELLAIQSKLRDDLYIFGLTQGAALTERFNNKRKEIRGLKGLANRANELWAPIMLIGEQVDADGQGLIAEMHDLALRRAAEQVQDDEDNNQTVGLLSGLNAMLRGFAPYPDAEGIGLFPTDKVLDYLRSHRGLLWLTSPTKLTQRLRNLGIPRVSRRVDGPVTKCYQISSEVIRKLCDSHGVRIDTESVTESVTAK
jgi:hypothetical protein